MRIEKLSLTLLAVTVLSVVVLIALGTTFVSESEYRKAAMGAQAGTVSRVLELASASGLERLADDAERLATITARAIASQPGLNAFLNEAPAGTSNPALERLLEASLQTDLTTATPVAAALYNDAWQLLAFSGDDSREVRLDSRTAADSPVLWQTSAGPRYSFVRPLEMHGASGYLELRFDPALTLWSTLQLIQLPTRINTISGDAQFETTDWTQSSDATEVVSYTLNADDGQPLLQLAALQNFTALGQATLETRNTMAVSSIILIGIALFIAIGMLNRFLFRPLRTMIIDMNRVAMGETNIHVSTRALKEFHTLANAFNAVTQKNMDMIERERQVAEDIKGKVELIQDVVKMAAQGNLTGQIMVYRDQDIISELAAGIQSMLDSLNSLVSRIQQSGVQVTSSATEIAATAKQQEATANETAATTNQIKATVTEITATSKGLVSTMSEVTEVAWKTSEGANAGRSSLQRMEQTMHQMNEATVSISSKLAVLSEKAGNINTVVTTINRVADQTNLLSLNAAIEAEKAGEYGVGFAVVATEIRRLADQTAVATWDIEQMVKEMQSAVSAGVMGMEKFSEEVRHGVNDVRQVGAQLSTIIEQVETLIPRFEEVNEGMASQAQGGNQIREAMVQLSESAQQTADSLRQSNGAIMQLNEAAQRLQEGASHFRVS
ncbi:MAG: methyl-accepting chemotaxis protein [Thiogranum sp.]|nr:methyl-accepting chemotaxis protein [Thiogranum sp.]